MRRKRLDNLRRSFDAHRPRALRPEHKPNRGRALLHGVEGVDYARDAADFYEHMGSEVIFRGQFLEEPATVLEK